MSRNYLFQEIIVKNPVLIGTIGLCPIVAICTSLKSALIMSAITILTLIVAQALSSLLLRHLPQWIRMSLYMLVGMLVVVPSILLIERLDPTTMLALGIYLPLLAVNPVIVRQCEREGVNIGLVESLVNSLCAGFGYSAVLIVVGVVREIFGNGTIWGVRILPIVPAAGMLMPMGGFVILAFMAALLRAYFRKIDPAFAEELAVNSRTAIKGHKGLKSLLLDMDDEEVAPRFEIIQMSGSKEIDNLATGEEDKAEQETPNPVSQDKKHVSAEEEIEQILRDVALENQADTAEPEMSNDVDFAEEPALDTGVVLESSEDKTPKAEGVFAKFGKKPDKPKAEKQPAKSRRGKAAKAAKTAQIPAEEVPVVPEEAKPKYEFITLELPSAAKRQAAEKAAAEKAAAEKAAAEKAEAKKVAKEVASKSAEETPVFAAPISEEEARVETSTAKKKSTSNIVYRSDELERLMSMSLDDILDSLPKDNKGEESEK